MIEYSWIGSKNHYVDEIHTEWLINNVVIGHYGGNSSGGILIYETSRCHVCSSL